MRLNIITEGCGWILERCARELEARLPDVTVDGNRRAAINYYLPFWKRTAPEGFAQIGLFTHNFDRAAAHVGVFDEYVCMNEQMARHLRHLRVPEERLRVIRPGHFVQEVGARPPTSAITFGIAGNVYRGGRKGEHLVARMVEAGYDVEAFGTGWPCPRAREADDLRMLPAWYTSSIDYLVITSTDEGGPMPLLDALHYGCPVIAPTGVGWCDEFPCIRYRAGDWPDLQRVLRGLTELPTWQGWADGHRVLLEQLRSAA